MLKIDFFHNAMKARRYLDVAWITSCFAITKPTDNASAFISRKTWDVVSDMSGYFFIDEKGERQKIEDAVVGNPLLNKDDTIVVKPGDAPNIRSEVETTYGDLLFNWIAVVDAAGDIVEFVPRGMTVGKLLKKIRPVFTDDPLEGESKKPGRFYVSDYLRLSRNVYNVLAATSQLFTTSMAEKHLVVNPEMVAYKNKLLEEYKDRLDDPVTVVEIQSKIKAADKATGDVFLKPKKNATARAKISQMFGVEPHPSGDPTKVYLIQKSLDEGLDIKDLPVLFNTVRSGSYARGYETQLGGVVYKDMIRAISGLEIDDGYCGTKIGFEITIDDQNKGELIGHSLVGGEQPILIENIEQAQRFVGKLVQVALPAYCKSPVYHYCRTCVGEVGWLMRDSTAQSAAAIGQGMMGIFMAAMHGQDFEVEEFNIQDIV